MLKGRASLPDWTPGVFDVVSLVTLAYGALAAGPRPA